MNFNDILFFALCLLIIYVSLKIEHIESHYTSSIKIQKDEILNHILKYTKIQIVYNKLYAFNPIKNCILIKDKDSYNLLDLFTIMHEIGHEKDNIKYNNIILINSYINGISKFLIFPVYILFCFVLNNIIIKNILFKTLIIFFIFRMFFLIVFELKASLFSINTIEKEIKLEPNEIKPIKKFYKSAYVQQILLETSLFLVAVFISTISQ